MMQLTIGQRGEIVIPKKVRTALGLGARKEVLLTVENNSIHITPIEENIVEKWALRAKKEKVDVSKWIMGDELYEEVF
jgi:AbrB family looped-hinge helix DNA binding protein